MAILMLEKKIFSEIPSNARHAESLLRLTAQSLPDLVPGLNFYWNNNDDFFQTILLTMANSWLLFQIW